MACPGSVALISQYPRQKTTKYAAEGTLAHAVAEAVVRQAVHKDETNLAKYAIGTEHEVEGHVITVDQEMYDGAMLYLETIGQLFDMYGLTPDQILLETKVSIPGDPGDEVDKFGTADCVIPIPYQPLFVIDYKYGKGKRVDVNDNKQLKYYGLGALLAMPPYLVDTVDSVILVVVQPRTPYGDPVTKYMLDKAELLSDFKTELNEAARKCTPDAARVPGKHCNECFCPVQAVCPEAKNKAVEIAQKDFANVQLPAVYSQGLLPRPEALTPEQRANVLDGKKFLESWLDAVYEYSLFLEETNPGSTPGYKLVAKRSHRKWLPEAENVLSNKFGPKAYKEVKQELKTPAQLEKVLGKGSKDLISTLCETPFTGSNLVPLGDRRDEIVKIPGQEFAGAIIDV
jgi:hypothetical protein